MNVEMREKIISCSIGWVGTPYHHNASIRGVGADCSGLVRGVWRELSGLDLRSEHPYEPNWHLRSGVGELLLDGLNKHFVKLESQLLKGGDIVCILFRQDYPCNHCGIMMGGRRMLHVVRGGPACIIDLTDWWSEKIVCGFRFGDFSV
jgi:NlpC/P60 family putative phage cell wall peptidase